MKRKDNKGRILHPGESQRKDGMYQYRYQSFDGTRKTVYSWRLVRSDRIPAEKKEDISLREKEKEIQENLKKGMENRGMYLTLNDMFDSYLVRKKHKGRPLADNTRINYKAMWDKNIRNSILGNKKLMNITKMDIVYHYQQLQEQGISYGTILFFQKIISAVFNMAVDDEILLKNPAKRAMNEIYGEQKRRNALTLAQQEELLEYAKRYNRDMYRKLIVLLDSMCRISEFAGLTWSDVDMKERMITIDHQLQYKKLSGDKKATFHITPTKSRKARMIPMTEELYQVMKELKRHYFILRKEYEVDQKKDFLFYSSGGNLVYEGNFRKELDRLITDYNQTATNRIEYLTPHILRHTGCTRNAENGMDIKVLQYLMGHSSAQITNNIYNHVQEERARREVLKAGNTRANRA